MNISSKLPENAVSSSKQPKEINTTLKYELLLKATRSCRFFLKSTLEGKPQHNDKQ